MTKPTPLSVELEEPPVSELGDQVSDSEFEVEPQDPTVQPASQLPDEPVPVAESAASDFQHF